VIGNSQYKPTVSPLEIFIVIVTDTFPGGLISQIYATDRDPSDVLSFIQKPESESMFKINRQDGSIEALPGLEPGRYMAHKHIYSEKTQYCKQNKQNLMLSNAFSCPLSGTR